MHDSFAPTALRLLAVFFLVFLNGFFVAAEFAIVKVRGTKIRSLARKGSRRARMTQHLIEHLDAYLSATQLGITIASILLGWLGEETMRHVAVQPLLTAFSVRNETVIAVTSFILGTGIIVFLHVVLGELAPKSLAIQRSESTALWVSYPMRWFYVLMYPLIALLNNTANFFVRLVGIRPAAEMEMAHSEEELRLILAESQRSGALSSEKRDLLENVFDLSRHLVRQIMVPRTEVACFNLRKTLAENLLMAERTAHSRYPLVDGDLDHVVGVVHMKDLFWQLKEMELTPDLAHPEEERRNPMIAGGDIAARPPASGAGFLRKIAREALFAPDTMRIDNLLREFQQKRVHLAIVVDEYGGTLGLVTFENVIEEIVGEVQDEFDHEAPRIRAISKDEYLLDGATPLPEVNEALGTNLQSEDVDTVAGFVMNELGQIPKPGDKVAVEGVELIVREMRRQRVHRIVAHLSPPAAGSGGGPAPAGGEN